MFKNLRKYLFSNIFKMSFYSVQNPARFSNQNPNIYTAQTLEFLRSGFQQPDAIDSLSNITGSAHTYSAAEILNRYTVRSGLTSDPTNDTTCNAEDLIQALNNDQWIRKTAQDSGVRTVRPSFYFDWTIYNEDNMNELRIVGGLGVNIGVASYISIPAQKLVVVRVIVTNATPGSEEVYISILSNL
jgi:hypothetical protein